MRLRSGTILTAVVVAFLATPSDARGEVTQLLAEWKGLVAEEAQLRAAWRAAADARRDFDPRSLAAGRVRRRLDEAAAWQERIDRLVRDSEQLRLRLARATEFLNETKRLHDGALSPGEEYGDQILRAEAEQRAAQEALRRFEDEDVEQQILDLFEKRSSALEDADSNQKYRERREEAERQLTAAESQAVIAFLQGMSRRLEFLRRLPERLRALAPPVVRSVAVRDEGDAERLRVGWKNLEDEAGRRRRRERETCEEALENQQRLLPQLESDVRERRERFLASHARWMKLNRQYQDVVWRHAQWNIYFALADSGSEILGGAGNPAAMLGLAALEAGGRIYDALYGERPAFAEFPRLPREWIEKRQALASNPALEAERAFSLVQEATGAVGPPSGALDLGPAVITKAALQQSIVDVAETAVLRERARRLGFNAVNDALRAGGTQAEDVMRVLSPELQAEGRKWTLSYIENVKQPQFRAGIVNNLLMSAGKAAVDETVRQSLTEQQAQVFAQMFQEELVYFLEQREFVFASARLRRERQRLDSLLQLYEELAWAAAGEYGTRTLETSVDQSLRPGAHVLTVAFDRPVTEVRVLVQGAMETGSLGSSEEGRVHAFRFQLGAQVPPNGESRVTIEASDSATGKPLDGDPATVARYDGASAQWIGYESSPDPRYRILVARGRAATGESQQSRTSGQCPGGTTAVWEANGHTYELVQAGLTWEQAKNAATARSCGGVKGHLVTITSAAENAFLVKSFSGFGSFVWIGASDVQTEGQWRWMVGPEAGRPLAFTSWGAVEPNNEGDEDVAALNLGGLAAGGTDRGQWGDTKTWATMPGYIVEYP